MRTGASTSPRRETTRTRSPSTRPIRSMSSGDRSSASRLPPRVVVAARLDAGVVRVQPPAGGEPDRELVGQLVDRRVVLHGHERRAVAGNRVLPQPRVEEQLARVRSRRSTATGGRPRPRAARTSSRDGPGRASRTSFQTFSARGLAPVVAEPAGELEEDPQVVARLARRLERLAHPLDPTLGVRDRALGLGPRGGGREDDIGDLGGRGQEDVLDDEQVEAPSAGRSVRWRSASDWSGFSPRT